MDSTALSELVKLRNYVAKLGVTQPTGSVLRLFDVAHIAALFEVRPSLDAALAEIDAGDDNEAHHAGRERASLISGRRRA